MQPKRKLGRGIFPSPSAYIEGKRSEFFQVPAPIWYMRGTWNFSKSQNLYRGRAWNFSKS